MAHYTGALYCRSASTNNILVWWCTQDSLYNDATSRPRPYVSSANQTTRGAWLPSAACASWLPSISLEHCRQASSSISRYKRVSLDTTARVWYLAIVTISNYVILRLWSLADRVIISKRKTHELCFLHEKKDRAHIIYQDVYFCATATQKLNLFKMRVRCVFPLFCMRAPATSSVGSVVVCITIIDFFVFNLLSGSYYCARWLIRRNASCVLFNQN